MTDKNGKNKSINLYNKRITKSYLSIDCLSKMQELEINKEAKKKKKNLLPFLFIFFPYLVVAFQTFVQFLLLLFFSSSAMQNLTSNILTFKILSSTRLYFQRDIKNFVFRRNMNEMISTTLNVSHNKFSSYSMKT